MSMQGAPLLFAFASERTLAQPVANMLDIGLAGLEERAFEDGEHKTRPLVSVRDRDVYVLGSLAGDGSSSANDKLCRTLFLLAGLRDAGAARITAIAPYLCYARKDRRTKPRDPVTSRYVAQLFEAVGVDCLVTIDVHNLAAFQNASRIVTEHLEARWSLAQAVVRRLSGESFVVVSPDAGGVKRADRFRDALGYLVKAPVGMAFVEKYRSEGRVSGGMLVGEVAGRTALVVDDLVSSGTTLVRAAESCLAAGARSVHALVTHGVFAAAAESVLAAPALASLTVTDTIDPRRIATGLRASKVDVVGIAPLVAEAIRRLHAGGSIVDLVERPPG